MKKTHISFILLFLSLGILQTKSQITSTSSNLVAQPVPDRTVLYNTSDAGVAKPIIWGLDLAWLSETNIRRGILFMGADKVDVVRASFQPTLPLVNGDLQTAQINDLNTRLNLIDLTGTKTKVVLNCDHPSVDASYIGNAANWAALIDATTKRVQARNRTVVSVSPFNEPDFGWGQYSGSNGQSDFYNIAVELRKNPRFDSIRICGGNTLNTDQALSWYNYLKTKLDEGNTHQLAGSFDNYASFFQTVRTNGDMGTADELHNVMEAMVGVEYGMQTGIWWGTAELARGEFVKASDGVRLGYAEHRPNWTSAAVYRQPNGKIQAFGGTSERQAVTTTYRFVSKERDVFYDGYGPQREYTMVLPGGTGYQNGQTNAERVVNITWGADIQPVINGKYILVNKMSSKVLEVLSGSTASGASLCQRAYNKNAVYQQWNVTPVDSRIGGDFSYFSIVNVSTAKVPDVLNFSLDAGAKVIQYDDNKNANQQWYLEYAGDGWFFIRNRHSSKCLEVASPYVLDGALVQQGDKGTSAIQLWRFVPVGSAIEFAAPAAPANLTATANATSVRLDWTANAEADLSGYTVFRTDSAGKNYNTIARDVKTSSFVDNTVTSGKQYYYTVKAVDNSLNRSAYSNETSAIVSGANDLVANYKFESNTLDSTINLNHSASYGTIAYADAKFGTKGISLNGTNAFVQLPATVANYKEMTIATWVYTRGTTAWQRIFDFGNDQNQNMFLTSRSNSAQLRFAIKNGGAEQAMTSTALPLYSWSHVAVTLSSTGAKMYVNGVQVAESNAITISPLDFKPVLNYIGRSQYTDPLFNGIVEDFRIYNYALSGAEVMQISGLLSDDKSGIDNNRGLSVSPIPANDVLHVNFPSANSGNKATLVLLDACGKQIFTRNTDNLTETDINVSGLSSGLYILKFISAETTLMKKLIIRH